MIERVICWGPAVLWAVVLFFLSEKSPSSFTLFFGADKVVHGALYFVLGLALAWSWYRGNAVIPVSVFILMGSGYGVFDEWHQSFVPGRHASVGDAVVDAIGVIGGFAIFRRRGLSFPFRGGDGLPQPKNYTVD